MGSNRHVVPETAAGERLDRFVAALPGVGSRAASERLLAAGAVLVDGEARPKSHRLTGGEEVRVESGALHAVELPGAAARYELAGKHHHHHFHCRRCDGVFEVDACPAGIRGLLPRGFRLEGHEIVLYGLCARCGARA